MTIVQDDECDGQPRIEGTTVSVIDVYHMAIRAGRDSAKVAHEYDVDLARVHEAIAYYYDHAERMRELEDWDELAPATADRDDWTDSTPTDAGESLFGDFDTEREDRTGSTPTDVDVDVETLRIAVVGASAHSDDIRRFQDRHGVDALGEAVKETIEYVNGNLTRRGVAERLDIPTVDGIAITQDIERVIAAMQSDSEFKDDE